MITWWSHRCAVILAAVPGGVCILTFGEQVVHGRVDQAGVGPQRQAGGSANGQGAVRVGGPGIPARSARALRDVHTDGSIAQTAGHVVIIHDGRPRFGPLTDIGNTSLEPLSYA
jgi:hypothetical protein